ncbi:MAG: hypothetical protein QOK10_3585 [Pseudonocardiales bacterium]|jgi:hypothetical protein|nr:hypothetical protein [Pseudonocardiales bacterium]
MSIFDSADIERLARTLNGHAAELERDQCLVRNSAACLHWSSPAASAFARSLELWLGQSRATAAGLEQLTGCLIAHARRADQRLDSLARLKAPFDAARRNVPLLDLL